MMPILGKSMLARVIERTRLALTLDDVVVATTVEPGDDIVAIEAARSGAGVFRGSEHDVLDRVVGAAKAHDATVIVEITGDCPLTDPSQIDKVVTDFRLGGADFVANIHPHTTPRGTDVRVFTSDALAEINERSTDAADHEHVSLHFWEHPERYRLRNVSTPSRDGATDVRLTVDTEDDMALVRAIYGALYPRNPAFSLDDVLDFLEQQPALRDLNRDVVQRSVR